jgi:hypothetical protein
VCAAISSTRTVVLPPCHLCDILPREPQPKNDTTPREAHPQHCLPISTGSDEATISMAPNGPTSPGEIPCRPARFSVTRRCRQAGTPPRRVISHDHCRQMSAGMVRHPTMLGAQCPGTKVAPFLPLTTSAILVWKVIHTNRRPCLGRTGQMSGDIAGRRRHDPKFRHPPGEVQYSPAFGWTMPPVRPVASTGALPSPGRSSCDPRVEGYVRNHWRFRTE